MGGNSGDGKLAATKVNSRSKMILSDCETSKGQFLYACHITMAQDNNLAADFGGFLLCHDLQLF